jgi:opacity protein-like surface antigen
MNRWKYLFVPLFLLFVDKASGSDAFRFGVKAGAGTTYLTHHHLYMLGDSRITFTVGGTAEYLLKEWWTLHFSAEYTHKGGAMLNPRLFYAKGDAMLGIPELGKTLYRTNLTIHTIEFPLTARFLLPIDNSPLKPFLDAGTSFGRNFFARADNYYLWEFENAPNDLLDETSDRITDKIARWNISVYTGLGTELNAGKHMTFEIGYTFRLGMTYEDRFLYTLYHKFSTISTLAYVAVKW